MKRNQLFAIVGALALLILPIGGVHAEDPIISIENQPVGIEGGGAASAEQVKRAIMAAGSLREWQMTDMEPGIIRGIYAKRGFSAEVRVEYSAAQFSIKYVTSTNLDYGTDRKGQTVIHGNYNRWVANLRSDTLTLMPYFGYCAK